MKLPDLPEEQPKDEKPQPKYQTQKKVYRARSTPPSKSTERKPVSLFGGRPAAKPEQKAPVRPAPVPPADRVPTAPSQTGTSSQVPPPNAPVGRGINPGLKLRAVEAAGKTVPPTETPVTQTRRPLSTPPTKKPKMSFLARFMTLFDQSRKKSKPAPATASPQAGKTRPESEPIFDKDFFTIRKPEFRKSLRAGRKLGGILSLIINVILLGIVLVLMSKLNALNTTLNNVLGGLYENFVNMDNASIVTTINVDDMPIPLDFILPVVQEETYVTLTRSVTIHNAIVGVLSVPTTVTLPAGTALPVSLNMNVPVQTTVLVDIQVPVNINLAQSNPPGDGQVGLHDAFLGLQNTIGPFYCLFKQDLFNAAGGLVCQQGAYTFQDINP